MRAVGIVAYVLILIFMVCAPWLMNAAFEQFQIYNMLPAPPNIEQD